MILKKGSCLLMERNSGARKNKAEIISEATCDLLAAPIRRQIPVSMKIPLKASPIWYDSIVPQIILRAPRLAIGFPPGAITPEVGIVCRTASALMWFFPHRLHPIGHKRRY